MPSTPAVVNRRRVLAGGGFLALLAVTAPACGSAPAPPVVDELESQLELAHQGSQQAEEAAAIAPPTLAPALIEIAAERAEHARALATEIARAAGKSEPSPSEISTPTSTSEPTAPAVPDVVSALRVAADSAGKLATTSSGYRAGLLASIAAACTAAYTVALVPQP